MANRYMRKDAQRQWKLIPQWDTASHQSEWLSSINQQTISAGKNVEKGEPFCTVGGNADWWRAIWEYLKKIKNGSAFWPSDPTSGN